MIAGMPSFWARTRKSTAACNNAFPREICSHSLKVFPGSPQRYSEERRGRGALERHSEHLPPGGTTVPQQSTGSMRAVLQVSHGGPIKTAATMPCCIAVSQWVTVPGFMGLPRIGSMATSIDRICTRIGLALRRFSKACYKSPSLRWPLQRWSTYTIGGAGNRTGSETGMNGGSATA